MKVGFQVAYGETFKMMWPLVTLTSKSENIHLTTFDNISDTIYSRVMTHGQKVACKETLKNDVTFGDLDL